LLDAFQHPHQLQLALPFILVGGRELMQQHPGHYAHLLTSGSDPVDLEIMRDLNRTFPNHVFFHQRQGPGQQSLFHVLRAYSAHDRQVCKSNSRWCFCAWRRALETVCLFMH
jgi:hypothetical protein